MARKRKLRIIRDEDYGFTLGNTIHINIERLWKENPAFLAFVREFSRTHTHELLHVLFKNIRPKRLIGEEQVVHLLCEEPWDKTTQNFYGGLYA